MLTNLCNYLFYSMAILSPLFLDYLLGNGLVHSLRRLFCKVICAIRKFIKEEEKHARITGEYTVSLPVLVCEVVFIGLIIMFLNRFKKYRGKDKIDDLLQDSREALRQINDFLEKWRLRRINWQVPNEYSYLDDEPQEIEPFKLEVPILHMAIVDTLGTTRHKPERGDAGDSVNITDSTLLSVTSLLDDDLPSIPELSREDIIDVSKSIELRDRYLWDVLEEDNDYDDC